MALSASFVAELRGALGGDHVITEMEQLRTYECDGLTGHRAVPELVVLPGSTEEVQAVLRACHRDGVPFVARGAGTGLSGGATPLAGGVVVSLARMNRILEVDVASQRVVVEPGVANLDVTRAVEDEGFFYAPDPSSQQVCTIGGNVAENSGGAHCLKHGFTVHHVTGLTFVLPDGEVVELGGKALDPDGPDLLGVIVGSEGTLGIATRITLRIVRAPQLVRTLLAGFRSMDAAGAAVSGIVAAGVLPSAIEMMDALTIEAAERSVAPGYPAGAGAVLLVELDGVVEQVEDDSAEVERICAECGAFEIRAATDEVARALLWKGRKSAFAAMGRMATDYYVQDGVVPRTRLPEALRRIEELSARHGLRVGNVFHAGDGNLHPLVLYDAEAGETERARELAEAILEICMDAGGSLTGEHGVGMDKACSMPQMFSERDLSVFERVRRAFDPDGISQPGQGDPHAAALRRGAGPLPRARAGEDRRCRASLASRKPRSSSRTRSSEERRVRLGDDLTTEGLDRILEHEPGDLTCTVESGVRLSTLRAELARSGQRLSLDPPGDPTIGALLATNVSGPLRHRFGAPRDLVLGVTLVLADGTIASAGGKVVKNVAGYDLARLVCGSRGRLALIGRASFRLHPLPKATATLVVETDDAAAVVARLLRSQLQPSALDLLHPGRVVVHFEGSARAVEAQVAAARALVGGAPATSRSGTSRVADSMRRAGGSASLRASSLTRSRRWARR